MRQVIRRRKRRRGRQRSVRKEGDNEPVRAECDYAGADKDQASFLADSVPDQIGVADLGEGTEDDEGDRSEDEVTRQPASLSRAVRVQPLGEVVAVAGSLVLVVGGRSGELDARCTSVRAASAEAAGRRSSKMLQLSSRL